jgi:putative membrane protein
MLINALFAFLHFAGAFGVAATLFFEWLTFSRTPTLAEARKLQQADMLYGLCAGLVLIAGFARVFYFEKGSAFYFASPFFHVKLTLFVVIGLLSVYPTVKFLGWRKQTAAGQAPTITEQDYRRIAGILHMELGLLLLLMLSAALMAKGIGYGH